MLQPKPNIDKLFPCVHGGIDYSELEVIGISPDVILDFSTNCNPFGAPSAIQEAMNSACIENYPDSESTELRQTLSRKLGISPGNLLIGSGSTELIRLTAISYFGPEDSVIIHQPTYGEYEIACQLADAKVVNQSTSKKTSFQIDIKQSLDLIQKHQPKGIFLCNPNNPTGQYLSKEEVEQILTEAKKSLVILDEAYIAFTEDAWTSLDLLPHDNLVILRSMTKDYALAGLRLGYAIAAEPVISTLKRVRPPWNVTSTAQKAGVSALEEDTYISECGFKIQEAKSFLIRELTCLGLPPVPSQSNFFLVEVGNAAEFKQSLLRKGILVRDCTSFGLPDHIRLSPRSIPECQKLISAIKESRISQPCQL